MLITQFFLESLFITSIYILMSLGLTLIFGVMKIPNFLHGAIYTLGAYLGYVFIMEFGLNYFLGLITSICSSFLLGLVLERALFRRLLANPVNCIVAAMGLGMIITNLLFLRYGVFRRFIYSPMVAVITIAQASISFHKLITIVVGFLGAILIYLFIRKTKLGTAFRAVSQDWVAAASLGINVAKIRALAFGISCALAALASLLVGPVLRIYPQMGDLLMMQTLSLIVIGGMGKIEGAVLGSLLLGFVGNFVDVYVAGGYGMVVSFVSLIIILLIRPEGLLGQQ